VHTHRFLFGRRGKKSVFVLCICSAWRRPRSSHTKITRILIAGNFQHLSVTFVADFLTINWPGNLSLRGVLQHPDLLWDPPSLIFGGYRCPFTPAVKRPKYEADHSRPPVAGFRLRTATRYGLDGPGIEFRWGVRFSSPVQTGPGTLYSGFTGVKQSRRGVNHPPPSFAKVKERVSYTAIPPVGLRGLFSGEPYL